jgi:hypothetical protein
MCGAPCSACTAAICTASFVRARAKVMLELARASAPAADDCGGDSWAPALKPPMDFLPAYCSFFPAAVLFVLAGLKYPSAFLELVKLFSGGIGTSPAAFRSWAGHAFTLRCVAGGSV